MDKLTLAALEATLALYREPPRALREIPALAQLTVPVSDLRERATRIAAAFASAQVVETTASVGGGAFPTARIPSIAVAFDGDVVALERRLRGGEPPVVARIADGRLLADVRTVRPRDDELLATALRAALR